MVSDQWRISKLSKWFSNLVHSLNGVQCGTHTHTVNLFGSTEFDAGMFPTSNKKFVIKIPPLSFKANKSIMKM